MAELTRDLDSYESTSFRAEELFRAHQLEIGKDTDRLFARLMFWQWLAGIFLAFFISPNTWIGQTSQIHLHVWAAIFLGGAISVFPILMTRVWPGSTFTRHSVAAGQMLMSGLLIHLTGGRLETHFHVFGSLVILSFYRDWRVLIPATALVAIDHFVRGIYWPYSVYGVFSASPWRSFEHAGWVIFEDVFLIISCLRSVREMRAIAKRTADVEASEQRFRNIFEEAPLGMAVVGLDDRFLQVNTRLCQMVGYEEEELTRLRPGEISHPEDAPIEAQLVQRLVDGELPRCAIEKRLLRKDNEVLWITRTTSVIRDDNGQPRYFLTMIEDITERRNAAAALAESEQRFRQFAENIREVFWMTDPQKNQMLYISPAYEGIWGRTCDDLYRSPRAWIEAIHEEDRERVIEAAVMKQTRGDYHEEYRIIRPDGSVRWIKDRAFPIRDEDGAVYRVAGIAEDITQRKNAEDDLRLQTTLLESQSEASIDGILVISAEGRMLSFNRRFTEMWEIPPEVVALKSDDAALQAVIEKLADPNAFLAKVAHLYAHHDEECRDEVLLRDGRIFDRYSGPIKGEDGHYYGRIWFFRDITARKLAERELVDAKNEAEQANRAKSDFLSRMSHELRTPLNAILGFGQLLERQNPTVVQLGRISHIVTAGRHLLNLINEILDISRIEAGRLELSLEPVSVADAVREALGLIRPLAAERSITLSEPKIMDRKCHILADRQRFKQVVFNLVTNAINYSPVRGEVVISLELRAADRLRISVSDHGPGIPAEKLLRLFVPFDRLGAEQSDVQGTGLGLAVSKRLMEAMNGEIGVESSVGVGSTFWIDFPRVPCPIEKLALDGGLPASRRALNQHGASERVVLYIEDNLSNLTLIEQILAEQPAINLISAMQGELGLRLAREHSPDLILLDLHLPDMPGWEVLAQLKADEELFRVPVIVISADATPRQIEKLMAEGAHAYLTKPLDLPKFYEALEESRCFALAGKAAVA